MTTTGQPAWPIKTRDIHNHHMDSTRWSDYKFRDDDIVVASYGKSGTTWTQEIVAQLIFGGAEGVSVSDVSPWIDLRVIPPEAYAAFEAQTHRRVAKTHLPVDALVFSPKAKYVYVARDGRDIAWSMFNHCASANQVWYDALNLTPGRVGPPIDRPTEGAHAFYRRWFAGDGDPFWAFWENVRSWWAIRDLPNVKLLHYNDLKRDLDGSVRDLAAFLGVSHDAETMARVVRHSTFEYMKANAELMAPMGGIFWEGGARSFIYKGVNGRWTEALSAQEKSDYEARALSELGPECAAWLRDGALASREPVAG